MKNLTQIERDEILDVLGERVVENVRDSALSYAMDIATGKSEYQGKAKQYKALKLLTEEQKEKINDLLSETVSSVIFDFLHMFDENQDDLKLLIIKNGKEYDYTQVTEHAGSEINYIPKVSWLSRFSKVERFID